MLIFHQGIAACSTLLVVMACGGQVEGNSSNAAGAGGSQDGAVGTGGKPSDTGGTAGTAATAATGGAGGSAMPDATIDDSPPSCRDLPSNCGPSSNESCCTSLLVPGGTFYRSYDNVNAGYTSQDYPATVSDFRLDKYEITVGRFRKFLAEYSPNMIPTGAGKNPSNPDDPGWDIAWNTLLPTDPSALAIEVECADNYQTWTESPAANDNKPMNCITWYVAFAFCIWDGGRLPTEAEWNYAAAGGSEQRVYPWGRTDPDDSYAVFCGGSCSLAQDVGSKSPNGDGKWGQTDLAGNVYEWLLDWLERPYPQVPCIDCANTLVTTGRAFRGGAFSSGAEGLITSARNSASPWDPSGGIGVRCARAKE